MKNFPRIYLAVDNCFASKRWTAPEEWSRIIRDIGIACVEISADNEYDPLYTTPDYRRRWIKQARKSCEKNGIRIANFYSGHGTYATIGLAHTDQGIRRHILNDWLKVMVKSAGQFSAGLGFYCHAFCDKILQSPALYKKAEEDLYDLLAAVTRYARQSGVVTAGVEQMYSPHQIPWTIPGTTRLLKEVFRRSGHPFYITIDTGHQTGQRKFIRPDRPKIEKALAACKKTNSLQGIWLGPASAYRLCFNGIKKAGRGNNNLVEKIEREMDRYPYLFSVPDDGRLYSWLNKFACFSPIVHLQQTDGKSSSHLPFTGKNNLNGIVDGRKVLNAIAESYSNPDDRDLPPKCREIYLTLEFFSATDAFPVDIISQMESSVSYWRRFIPRDGLTLDELQK